jgi:hypothetical protein
MSVQLGLGLVKETVVGIIDRWPSVGIVASFTGFGASTLVFFNVISVLFGSLAAVFGAVAGFYTMLIQIRKWRTKKVK